MLLAETVRVISVDRSQRFPLGIIISGCISLVPCKVQLPVQRAALGITLAEQTFFTT